jgi:hypothetical protein
MPTSVPIVSFSGQVKSAESPVQGEGLLQMMHVAVETILDRLHDYLMPVGAQGTSRFLEIVWICFALPAGTARTKDTRPDVYVLRTRGRLRKKAESEPEPLY